MSVINLVSPTDLSGFYVVYKGSTNLEKKGIYGISHLMEHLVCKSVDPYQDELDELGITYNAYTSGNEIVFYLTGLDESLSKWRNKYIDLLSDFNVTKEEFENERDIILQEYMDSFNDQAHNHMLNFDRKKYNFFNPIGLKEDLENLKWMDCLNFFEKQYTHPSMIINVSKNIEFGTDIEFKTPENNIVYQEGDYPVDLQRDNEYKGKVSLLLKSKMINEDFNKINYVNYMLSSGLQSPFYQNIREKNGLVYYIGSYISQLNKSGVNTIYTMSSPNNIEKIVDIIDTIFKNPTKFLTRERFDVVNKSLKIKSKIKDINRYNNVDKYINGEDWSIYDILDDITYEESLEIAKKYFTMDNYIISRDDQEFK